MASGNAGGVAQGAGLAHDAGNLLGALQLYCDLLAAPGVLRAEHKHYAEEIRLLSGRSGTLIERLVAHERPEVAEGDRSTPGRGLEVLRAAGGTRAAGAAGAAKGIVAAEEAATCCGEGMGRVVQGCEVLLTGVGGGRAVELLFGPAANLPVRVARESVERVLVNLVRNAASAMRGVEAARAIRVCVGEVVNRANDPEPWVCRRVRLTVEDRGAGMSRAELERLTRGTQAATREGHGLGLRVVRELVEESGGEMRILSELGVGTCVQMEWPVQAAFEDTIDLNGVVGRTRLAGSTTKGLASATRGTKAAGCTAGKPHLAGFASARSAPVPEVAASPMGGL